MIVQLPALDLSNSAAARSKHWIKRLDRVDTTLSDGYAFAGEFSSFRATVEVPEGTFFLSYIEDVRGSGRLDGRDVTLYRAGPNGLETVETWSLSGARGWALKVRDQIAALMTAEKPVDRDALAAERARLVARIAEIDAALTGNPEPAGAAGAVTDQHDQ